jgi:septal ring factor EnvC (AmiA/AmiB activator)
MRLSHRLSGRGPVRLFEATPLPTIVLPMSATARRFASLALLALVAQPAAAQDVRGLEHCSAEKNLERRTSCLQSNAEFLQQAIQKNAREMQQKQAAADRELGAVKAQLAAAENEIAGLKDALAKLHRQMDDLRQSKISPEQAK